MSLTALPSRRNSGLTETPKSVSVALARRPLERGNHRLVCRPRQNGAANHDDVVADPLLQRLSDLLAHAGRDSVRSMLPFRRLGVLTETSDTSLSWIASSGLVVARSRPDGHGRRDELGQAWLDDGAVPGVDRGHLRRIDVDADHVVTIIGKRRGRHRSDVSQDQTLRHS